MAKEGEVVINVEGGCHCGAIRYAILRQPMQSMICHCRTCRAVSGGLVMAWITVDPETSGFTCGSPKYYRSSADVTRGFCDACGAQITYQRDDDASYIDIATTTLDDPDAFPPSHHSWTSHDVAWVKFGDGLPAYKESRGDG